LGELVVIAEEENIGFKLEELIFIVDKLGFFCGISGVIDVKPTPF
jgi:hypothetical protein